VGITDGRTVFSRPGKFLLYQEKEKDGPTAAGDEYKHWHTIDIIYRVE